MTLRSTPSPAPQLMTQALEACVVGAVITDAQAEDHPIIYVNPAFERLTGYGSAEILGRNCRFLQGQDRDQPPLEAIRRALAEGGGPQSSCAITARTACCSSMR